MPEESINIFISNIYAIAIFTGILLIAFLILFLVSRFFIKGSNHKKSPESIIVREPKSFILHSDTSLTNTLFTAGIIFINIIFLIIIIMLSIYFVTNFQVDKSLYMMILMIFLILLITAYVVRSKILKK